MRTVLTILSALFALTGPAAWGQEDHPKSEDDKKFTPEDDPQDDQPLTPQETMRLMKEARDLMDKAADHLDDSSRGKVERLLQKAETKQKGAIERLAEILRRIRSGTGPT